MNVQHGRCEHYLSLQPQSLHSERIRRRLEHLDELGLPCLPFLERLCKPGDTAENES